MAGNTRQVAAFGPAAIAVHDYCDMFWELVRIKLAVEFSFLSVQPRRNSSQYASQYTSTLAQQVWSCNFPALKVCKAGLISRFAETDTLRDEHFREYLKRHTLATIPKQTLARLWKLL